MRATSKKDPLLKRFNKNNERLHAIRTKLLQMQQQTNMKSAFITSNKANEGKSLITAQLAIAFAEIDKRVVIIDFNLRNPTVHKLFKVQTAELKDELLFGHQALSVFQTTIENVSIIPNAKFLSNPSLIITNDHCKRFLEKIDQKFDFIFIDGPSLPNHAESIVLADISDVVIYVTNVTKITEKIIQKNIQSIGKKCYYILCK